MGRVAGWEQRLAALAELRSAWAPSKLALILLVFGLFPASVRKVGAAEMLVAWPDFTELTA